MFGLDTKEMEKEYSGTGCSSARRGIRDEGGIACGIIKELYNDSKSNLHEGNKYGKITIALSAWILRGHLIVE